MLGWNGSLSPQLTVSILGGYQRTTLSIPTFLSVQGFSGTKSDYVFNADLAYGFEADTVHFTAVRQPLPLASGIEIETSSFGVSEVHKFAPRLELDSAVNYQFSNSTGTVNISQKYYLNANTKLIFHATESVDFSLSVRLQQQELRGVPGTINFRAVLIGLSYSPTERSLD